MSGPAFTARASKVVPSLVAHCIRRSVRRQGTAATALAGLYGALAVQGKPVEAIKDQRVVVVGAGSAGMGVVSMIAAGPALYHQPHGMLWGMLWDVLLQISRTNSHSTGALEGGVLKSVHMSDSLHGQAAFACPVRHRSSPRRRPDPTSRTRMHAWHVSSQPCGGPIAGARAGMVKHGLSAEATARTFWILDAGGLITAARRDIPAHVQPYARPADEAQPAEGAGLLAVVSEASGPSSPIAPGPTCASPCTTCSVRERPSSEGASKGKAHWCLGVPADGAQQGDLCSAPPALASRPHALCKCRRSAGACAIFAGRTACA